MTRDDRCLTRPTQADQPDADALDQRLLHANFKKRQAVNSLITRAGYNLYDSRLGHFDFAYDDYANIVITYQGPLTADQVLRHLRDAAPHIWGACVRRDAEDHVVALIVAPM